MADPKLGKDRESFHFKQFSVDQQDCSMKVGTDGILLGAWTDIGASKSILDIGTGTGLIALMMAQRSEAIIHAVEIDEAAWKEASRNFKNAPWSDRMTAFHVSVQLFAKTTDQTYDLIVSNPPFFSGGVFSANQDRNDVRHTVKLPNGDLLNATRNMLAKDGKFCVILPVLEGWRFKEMAKTYGLNCKKVTEVFPKRNKKANRLLMVFEKNEVELEEDSFVVWEQEGEYSAEFIEMTKDFYLNL